MDGPSSPTKLRLQVSLVGHPSPTISSSKRDKLRSTNASSKISNSGFLEKELENHSSLFLFQKKKLEDSRDSATADLNGYKINNVHANKIMALEVIKSVLIQCVLRILSR